MTDWSELTYIGVDVEGNGQQPPDLVELAVVPIKAGVIGRHSSWMVRPPRKITTFAARIHHITNVAVEGLPPFAQVRGSVQLTLDAADAIIAHNAHVDTSVLRRELVVWEPVEVFDTLKLARRFLPGEPSYKLGNLVEKYELAKDMPEELEPHRAAYDAIAAVRLFVHIATRMPAGVLTLEQLRGEEIAIDVQEEKHDALF